MIAGVRVKVCGITRPEDAAAALRVGADVLGLITYPKSPRYVDRDRFSGLADEIGWERVVVVSVSPSINDLEKWRAQGARTFQIHFSADTPLPVIQSWSQTVGPDHLWLAPKLPAGSRVVNGWLPLTGAFLFDGYAPDKFGGTGTTSDWDNFALHRKTYPAKTWILSGGLGPDNVAPALARTKAAFIDVNSGVEARPGIKDEAKLEALATAVSGAR